MQFPPLFGKVNAFEKFSFSIGWLVIIRFSCQITLPSGDATNSRLLSTCFVMQQLNQPTIYFFPFCKENMELFWSYTRSTNLIQLSRRYVDSPKDHLESPSRETWDQRNDKILHPVVIIVKINHMFLFLGVGSFGYKMTKIRGVRWYHEEKPRIPLVPNH